MADPIDILDRPRGRSTTRTARSLDDSRGANQDDAQSTDINRIVAQYAKNGTLPIVNRGTPLYGDFTTPTDIHSVREAVNQAEDRFDQLPASVRTAANNDWVTFLEMFNDETGRETLEDAGLQITDAPSTSPASTEKIPPAPPPGPVVPTNTPSPTVTDPVTPTT